MNIETFYEEHTALINHCTREDWVEVLSYFKTLKQQIFQNDSMQDEEKVSRTASAYKRLIFGYRIIQRYSFNKGKTESAEKWEEAISQLQEKEKNYFDKIKASHTHNEPQGTPSLSA